MRLIPKYENGEVTWVRGWIGVDLDATLTEWNPTWWDINTIGVPVPKMIARVKRALEEGEDMRIFTARVVFGPEAIKLVERWCEIHVGVILPVTNSKDPLMKEIWDDRARQVLPNDGEFLDERYYRLLAEYLDLRNKRK